jgi:hypothetical protein
MASYLLPLSTLHAAAPGVLDVVFGPDGDFEGAPDWIGQVWAWSPAWGPESRAACFRPVTCVYPETVSHGMGGGITRFEHAALDLRVPSIAARLAGLCARALGCPADAAFMADTGTPEQGFVAFRAEWALISGRRWIWNRGTGAELSERPAGVFLPPRCDAASGLAALTLALAPRIVKLVRPS